MSMPHTVHVSQNLLKSCLKQTSRLFYRRLLSESVYFRQVYLSQGTEIGTVVNYFAAFG